MTHRFEHRNQFWSVTSKGWGVGVGKRATHYSVEFRSLSDPRQEPLLGYLLDMDPRNVDEDQLRRELDKRLVFRAIESSEHLWRTVEGLSAETGIEVELLRHILEGDPDGVIRSIAPDKIGRALYTTRSKYKKSQGFLRRYLDVLDSSST